MKPFLLFIIFALIALIASCILVFIINGYKFPKQGIYTIISERHYFSTNNYLEKDGCIFFDDVFDGKTKLCGTYIIKNKER